MACGSFARSKRRRASGKPRSVDVDVQKRAEDSTELDSGWDLGSELDLPKALAAQGP